MKKVLTIIILLKTCLVFGQIDKPITKGNWAIGGSIGSGWQTSNNHNVSPETLNSSYFNFAPGIGYFVMNGLSVGLNPIFTHSSNDYKYGYSDVNYNYSNSNSSTINTFGIEPYLKYYFKKGFFLGLNVNFSKGKQIADSKTDRTPIDNNTGIPSTMTIRTTEKFNQNGMQPSLGYALFVNQKVALEASYNYLYWLQKRKTSMEAIGGTIQGGNNRNGDVSFKKSYFAIGISVFL